MMTRRGPRHPDAAKKRRSYSVSVTLVAEENARVIAACEAHGLSRHALLKRSLLTYLDVLEDTDAEWEQAQP